MKRRHLAALVLPLTLTACGNDDTSDEPEPEPTSSSADSSADSSESSSESTSAEAPSVEAGGALSEEDETSIEDTLREFILTGDCELATDDYLRDLYLFSDEDTSREEACAAWEKTFVEPLYTEEDILLTDLVGEDGVATVAVGSEIAPDLTITYRLSLVDGDWLVSGDEINTDGL